MYTLLCSGDTQNNGFCTYLLGGIVWLLFNHKPPPLSAWRNIQLCDGYVLIAEKLPSAQHYLPCQLYYVFFLSHLCMFKKDEHTHRHYKMIRTSLSFFFDAARRLSCVYRHANHLVTLLRKNEREIFSMPCGHKYMRGRKRTFKGRWRYVYVYTDTSQISANQKLWSHITS